MGIALPSESRTSLEDSCPCRSIQLRQLTTLYSVSSRKSPVALGLILFQGIYPPPRRLVVHGFQGTGKLTTVLSVLAARQLTHAVIKSRECLSLRHLLSKILAACLATIYPVEDEGAESDYESRCESVNALGMHLQRLLQGRHEKLVIVLDGIDKQRGLHPHTLPALARLSDIVSVLEELESCSAETFFSGSRSRPHSHSHYIPSSLTPKSRHPISPLSTLYSS